MELNSDALCLCTGVRSGEVHVRAMEIVKQLKNKASQNYIQVVDLDKGDAYVSYDGWISMKLPSNVQNEHKFYSSCPYLHFRRR